MPQPKECPPVGSCYPVIVTGVRDGDTVDVTILVTMGLRLKDIQAPELRMEGGREAKEALEDMIRFGDDFKAFIPHVGSHVLRGLSFDRLVGYLFDKEGNNIGQKLVEAGFAVEV